MVNFVVSNDIHSVILFKNLKYRSNMYTRHHNETLFHAHTMIQASRIIYLTLKTNLQIKDAHYLKGR
jgi:hypothetical protein